MHYRQQGTHYNHRDQRDLLCLHRTRGHPGTAQHSTKSSPTRTTSLRTFFMLVSAHQRSYLALFRAVLCSTVAQSTKTIHRKEFPLPSAPHASYQVTENSLRFRDPLSRRGDGSRQPMIEDASQRSLRCILDFAEQLHIGKTRSAFDARSLPRSSHGRLHPIGALDTTKNHMYNNLLNGNPVWKMMLSSTGAAVGSKMQTVRNSQRAVTKKMPNWFQRDFRVRITSVNVWET